MSINTIHTASVDNNSLLQTAANATQANSPMQNTNAGAAPSSLPKGHQGDNNHGLSTKKCIIVWLALMMLTAITVGVAEVNLGFFHVLVAMAVATIKAGLVILWFMHVKYEGTVVRCMIFIVFTILAIWISFTFFDVAYR